MRKIRQIHLYVGLFFTPLILLFSVSGALQTFRLHEAHVPADPKPPTWIVWIATVHKDQALPGRPHAEKSAHETNIASRHRSPIPSSPDKRTHSNLPLKVLVTAMSLGLILSTILGVAIALNNSGTRRLSMFLLAAGTLRTVFGFIGIVPEVVVAEGLAVGPEHREAGITSAEQAITALAA